MESFGKPENVLWPSHRALHSTLGNVSSAGWLPGQVEATPSAKTVVMGLDDLR